MMDATLAQLLNHIYDLEQEKAAFVDFFEKNRKVLEANNTNLPEGVAPNPETQTEV
jgi:hypothetical protein